MGMVAIPLKEPSGFLSPVNEHFSRSRFFILIDPLSSDSNVIENTAAFTPGHEGTLDILHSRSVTVILCSGMGPGAMDYARELGIQVCYGRAKDAKGLYDKYLEKRLENLIDGKPCREL